ncbi:MAG: hypothetical protein JWP78_2329 [Mucilaginibacter sp.]|nr:hypothetical protein [Mucilaginibacter sp.]
MAKPLPALSSRVVKFLTFLSLAGCFLLPRTSLAQAPVITYTITTQTYAAGTAISLTRTNTGGALNAVYGQVTTFAGSGTAAYAEAARLGMPDTVQ